MIDFDRMDKSPDKSKQPPATPTLPPTDLRMLQAMLRQQQQQQETDRLVAASALTYMRQQPAPAPTHPPAMAQRPSAAGQQNPPAMAQRPSAAGQQNPPAMAQRPSAAGQQNPPAMAQRPSAAGPMRVAQAKNVPVATATAAATGGVPENRIQQYTLAAAKNAHNYISDFMRIATTEAFNLRGRVASLQQENATLRAERDHLQREVGCANHDACNYHMEVQRLQRQVAQLTEELAQSRARAPATVASGVNRNTQRRGFTLVVHTSESDEEEALVIDEN